MQLTAGELISYLSNGYAFMPAVLDISKGRKAENFIYADCFGVDVDSGLTLDAAFDIPETSKAIAIYTTPSHTKENHRFRIIFPFSGRVSCPIEYRETVEYFTKKYGADEQCKDVSRFFFGSSEGKFLNIHTGETIRWNEEEGSND